MMESRDFTMEKNKNNIALVVLRGLCTMCGVCAGVCPRGCIRMAKAADGGLWPVVAGDACTGCGLCARVCPGHEVDFETLASSPPFGSLRHALVGRYVGCYVGHWTDEDLRRRSSSGGLATGLLIHALDSGGIQGAAVARMRGDRPLESEAAWARTREEVLAAAGSKYCPVAMGGALREALPATGRFGLVGLPCHLHGVRKAARAIPRLQDRTLLIGLFCGYGKTYRVLDHALRECGVRREDVAKVEFRHGGWPGNLRVECRDGQAVQMPFGRWFRRECSPSRCTLCCDGCAELADVSCGDAWLPEYKGRYPGISVVVTRTEAGERAVREAMAAGVLSLQPVDAEFVVRSQGGMLSRKKRLVGAHAALRRWRGGAVPLYGTEARRPRGRDVLAAVVMNVRLFSASHRGFGFFNRMVSAARTWAGAFRSKEKE